MTKYLLLILLFFTHSLWAKEKIIMAAHPDFPPVMYEKEKMLYGVGPELAKMIFKKLKVSVVEKAGLSWAEVQESSRKGESDFVAGIYRTKDREEYLEFAQVPFMFNPAVALARKESHFKIKSPEDLKGKKGGAIQGEKYSQKLEDYIKNNPQTIVLERLATTEECFKALAEGRVDYIIYGHHVSKLKMAQLGIEDKIEAVSPPLYLGKFYFAFSKKSPYKKLLPLFNKEVEKYTKDGTVERLIYKHIKAYLEMRKGQ